MIHDVMIMIPNISRRRAFYLVYFLIIKIATWGKKEYATKYDSRSDYDFYFER